MTSSPKTSLKQSLRYLAVTALAFYLLPFVIRDTGSGMLILLIVLPAVCFILGFLLGLRSGINLIFVVLLGILFLPTLFLHYNSSAWVYAPAYALLALAGNWLGALLLRRS